MPRRKGVRNDSRHGPVLPLFLIWRREELEQAVAALTRAVQARWNSLAIVLVLWQWGLRNREDAFSSIVDRHWAGLVATMAAMDVSISRNAVSAAALCKARQGVGRATAEGESYTGQAAQLQISPSAVTQRKDTIAKRARAFWGESAVADTQVLPLWRRQMGRG